MERFDILTADDEEPECGRCNHFDGGFDCEKHCGPEHSWNGYQRTVEEGEIEEWNI